MRYITTEFHPQLKRGIILSEKEYINFEQAIYDSPCMDNAIENGYIKEVEEKEFTKNDVIELILFHDTLGRDPKYVLSEFLKQRAEIQNED